VLQVANVVRKFLEGRETGKAMEIWNASQNNREIFLNMRVRDPAYLMLPASSFSQDVDSHSNDIKDVAELFNESSTSEKAHTPAA
jgi:hypothetical protein